MLFVMFVMFDKFDACSTLTEVSFALSRQPCKISRKEGMVYGPQLWEKPYQLLQEVIISTFDKFDDTLRANLQKVETTSYSGNGCGKQN